MAVTIKDIARVSGLSVSTVSNYINGRPLREKNEKAVKQAIKSLNFKPNAIARGLRNSRTNTVGVLLPSLSNVFSAEIISSLESELLKAGCGTIICDCRSSVDLQLKKTEFLIDRMVDGIVTMPIGGDARHMALAKKADIPVVALDSLLDGAECDSVLIDNEEITAKAADALAESGHRRIALLYGPAEQYTSDRRLQGYKSALEARGIAFDGALAVRCSYDEASGRDAFIKLWNGPARPSAVIPSNYNLTNGVYEAINELGLSVPDDISLIGFDNTQLLTLMRPKPSLAVQPTDEIGRTACELLLRRINGEDSPPRKVFLTARLIINDSVKRLEDKF